MFIVHCTHKHKDTATDALSHQAFGRIEYRIVTGKDNCEDTHGSYWALHVSRVSWKDVKIHCCTDEWYNEWYNDWSRGHYCHCHCHWSHELPSTRATSDSSAKSMRTPSTTTTSTTPLLPHYEQGEYLITIKLPLHLPYPLQLGAKCFR